MSDTLFAYLKGAVSNADDTDPEQSSSFYGPPWEAHHNVLYYTRQTVALDTGDEWALTFPDSASGWVGVMARVIGEAKLTTVGVNWNGSSPVTGVTVGYGTDRHPGMISMVTNGVTSFEFAGLADDTELEYVAMILAADDAI